MNMKVQYHGQTYDINDAGAPQILRWLAAREVPSGVYRRIAKGKPLPGRRNDIYPDQTVRDGYCIAPAATVAKIGEEIRVGTGHLGNGMVGIVTGMGEPYEMAVESGVTDEDHNCSGFRPTDGASIVSVRRLYFQPQS